MDPHQTGLIGKGSDRLQLIKFWPTRAPWNGVCGGGGNFGCALLQPARSICVSSERFFIALCTELTNYAAFNHVNLTLWRYKKLSQTNCVQDKNRKCENFFELQQVIQPSRSLSTSGQLVLGKIFQCFFSSATSYSEAVDGFGWSFPEKLRASLAMWFKFGKLGGRCFFWVICRQFACRHCWATRAVCAEPHASRWICRSV